MSGNAANDTKELNQSLSDLREEIQALLDFLERLKEPEPEEEIQALLDFLERLKEPEPEPETEENEVEQ